jgi:tRNA threonylcarbamoyladenosine modification (KEOPS) complex Cgi121 subunit
LIFEIESAGNIVWISAFNAKPHDLDELLAALKKKTPEVTVQLVDLEKVAGSRYLLLATYNAVTSFESKHPIARTLSMEILLYIAATRQIQEAVIRVGVSPDTGKTGAVLVGKSMEQVLKGAEALRQLLKAESLDELVDRWDSTRVENVRSAYRIGEKEMKAAIRKNEPISGVVQRLLIERSAILSVKK